jgi:hypothetical protein
VVARIVLAQQPRWYRGNADSKLICSCRTEFVRDLPDIVGVSPISQYSLAAYAPLVGIDRERTARGDIYETFTKLSALQLAGQIFPANTADSDGSGAHPFDGVHES